MCTDMVQFLTVFKVIIVHPVSYTAGFSVNIFIFEMIQNQINVIIISLCVIALAPTLKMEIIRWLLLSRFK